MAPDPQTSRDGVTVDPPATRGAARLLGLAMAVVLGFGFWQGIAAMGSPRVQQRLAATLNLDAFLSGRTAAAVNHVMAHDLPLDGLLRAAGGVIRWVGFGSGGPAVAPGCGGWLYLTEELRPWPDADAIMAARAALLARVAARLAAEGIALRILIVPDKARMVPDMRCGLRYAAQAEARLPGFGALAARAGIASIDLAAAFGGDAAALYYRTDTHWNQAGARRAAAAVAAAMPPGLARDAEFRTEAAPGETDAPGDLLRLMSLEKVPDGLRPRPDRERVETTAALSDTAADSILDEAPVPEIVLLGSSFSVNANFHGALQQALAAPVGNLAKAGGGFAGAAREFFGSPAWTETPPRLVIWEFPERVLPQPLNADDHALAAWLDRPQAR
jgi:alginate O-acetyltransferase complex protein AlgJ